MSTHKHLTLTIDYNTCPRLSGYLFRRVSRTGAFLLGCSFIALQVSNHSLDVEYMSSVQGASALGIINVNWGRLSVLAQRRVQRLASNVTSRPSDTPLTQQVSLFFPIPLSSTTPLSPTAVSLYLPPLSPSPPLLYPSIFPTGIPLSPRCIPLSSPLSYPHSVVAGGGFL